MRHITGGIELGERKRSTPAAIEKPQIQACRNCGKKGHNHKTCRGQLTCFYCKVPGHRQFDCPNKKPGGSTVSRTQPKPSAVVAAVTGCGDAVPSVDVAAEVAAVKDPESTLEIASPLISISSICRKSCKLVALIDTGSPVSFITDSVYSRYCSELVLKAVFRRCGICVI